jgi:DNA-binding MarR family transcriptional regulator
MQEWFTMKDIADMYSVDVRDVRAAVRTLRRAGVISTTVNPKDEREMLVHQSGLEPVRKALLVDNGGTATA